jgi:AAA+ ATPase superfamily predicted ATPase
MFIGREKELEQLREFKKRKVAGIIVCSGRRRIGKSTLIEHFGEQTRFLEFYGLAPRDQISNKDQLDHFGELLGLKFKIPPLKFDNWNQALTTLAELTSEGRVIIFLDEISWMAGRDKDFAAKLKGIWDTKFKKNPELILVLCGSVSSWIQDNILNDKGFMGRVSLVVNLEEMPLYDANKFWGKRTVSSFEKFKILCVTGGIPRYLEEIDPDKNAEQNIKRMCFSKGGILVEEFEKIFNDIFGSRAEDYKKIIQSLAQGSLDQKELCTKLGVTQTGGFSKTLLILQQCGFLVRDYVWNGKVKRSKLYRFRLKDNYLRFYLRYIEPKKELITQGLYHDLHLEDLSEWQTIMGLQFENLVLSNLYSIQRLLQISPASVLSASPYFQRKTARMKACQVDLLIQTKHTLYVCEIKFRKQIPLTVIDDVKEKISKMKVPKTITVRPVLIYEGELSSKIESENYFSDLIPFEKLLNP